MEGNSNEGYNITHQFFCQKVQICLGKRQTIHILFQNIKKSALKTKFCF